MDSDHGDPEIQVLAEGALLHHLFEIPAGGANYPDINGMGDVRAQPLHTAFLQHTQEFGLQRQGQIADFIQENRASLGFFEATAPHLAGAGECAFFVPEEFILNQRFRKGAGGERNKWFVGTLAEVVDRPRDDAFACPAFSGDEHTSMDASNYPNY